MDEKEKIAIDRKPLIYNIQRYSIQDGPGTRTTIFLKGCPHKCPWCHNPDSQSAEKELLFDTEKCTGCGACVEVCPTGAAYRKGDEILLDRKICTNCGKCVEVCVPGAREMIGQETSIEEIIKTAKQDEMFFASSGGGITISGGDPMYFPEFTIELARRLKDEMLHVAVESAVGCQWKYLDELRNHVDLFLIDLKTLDETKYKEVIGGSLQVVMRNLESLLEAGASVRVRIPVIPGFNDSDADYDAFSSYLGALRSGLEGVDILPFHSYASKKWKISGKWDEYKYRETESLQPEEVLGLAKRLKEAGFSGKDSSLTIGGIL